MTDDKSRELAGAVNHSPPTRELLAIGDLAPRSYLNGIVDGNIDPTADNLTAVLKWAAEQLNAAALAAAQASGGCGETRNVTEADREYASELLADLTSDDLPRLEIAARWFRKARVEHSLPGNAAQRTGDDKDRHNLAVKIDTWSPQSKPLTLIARERRLIVDALRSINVAPSRMTSTNHRTPETHGEGGK